MHNKINDYINFNPIGTTDEFVVDFSNYDNKLNIQPQKNNVDIDFSIDIDEGLLTNENILQDYDDDDLTISELSDENNNINNSNSNNSQQNLFMDYTKQLFGSLQSPLGVTGINKMNDKYVAIGPYNNISSIHDSPTSSKQEDINQKCKILEKITQLKNKFPTLQVINYSLLDDVETLQDKYNCMRLNLIKQINETETNDPKFTLGETQNVNDISEDKTLKYDIKNVLSNVLGIVGQILNDNNSNNVPSIKTIIDKFSDIAKQTHGVNKIDENQFSMSPWLISSILPDSNIKHLSSTPDTTTTVSSTTQTLTNKTITTPIVSTKQYINRVLSETSFPQENDDDWFDVVPELISVKNKQSINISKPIGVNTIDTSIKSDTYDIRELVKCPKYTAPTFMNSSWEPDMSSNSRRYLEPVGSVGLVEPIITYPLNKNDEVGPTGPNGLKGDTGPIGSGSGSEPYNHKCSCYTSKYGLCMIGATGSKGETGATGLIGIGAKTIGLSGMGAKTLGQVGAIGVLGPTGATGAPGPSGATGAPGRRTITITRNIMSD